MQLSPIEKGNDKPRGAAAPVPPPFSGISEDDPPKIRVVVRKRPMNKKVIFPSR
jgi:hypothetical protein